MHDRMDDLIDDHAVAAIQLDRPLRAKGEVVARCPLDMPVVMKVPPLLDDGTPFPTLYWLTCPLALRRIGRIAEDIADAFWFIRRLGKTF